jgi:hypothetical protein
MVDECETGLALSARTPAYEGLTPDMVKTTISLMRRFQEEVREVKAGERVSLCIYSFKSMLSLNSI